jgi:hypothetical protein
MASATIPRWQLRGTVVQACNCNWGCPCDFNAPPSKGFCEGTWTWHIEQGNFGDVKMDGLSFAAACKWPGQVHQGNGEVLPILDDRASPEQLQAMGALLGGQAGGPWAIIAGTFSKVHEPKVIPWAVRLDGAQTTITAGDALTMKLQPMRNPVTGKVHEATVSLPTGFMSKAMHKAASSEFAVRGPVAYDYSGQDAAWGSFEYQGPDPR